MGVHAALDTDVQDLQIMVRTNRNAHLNASASVDSDEAELDQRNQLLTKLMRAGWIAPTYVDALKHKLRTGDPKGALALLCDVIGLDAGLVLEEVKA